MGKNGIQFFNNIFQNQFLQYKIPFCGYMQIFIPGLLQFTLNYILSLMKEFNCQTQVIMLQGDSFFKINFKRQVVNCRREMLMQLQNYEAFLITTMTCERNINPYCKTHMVV